MIEQPNPRITDGLSVNDSGNVVVAVPDLVTVRSASYVPTGRFTGRHGTFCCSRHRSAVIRQTFANELATILDHVVICHEPVYVIGDFNIRLDKRNDLHAVQLRLPGH